MKIITNFLNKNLKILFIFFIFFSVTQCSSSMKLEQFKNNKPEFKLEEYFKGKTVARGVFEDRFGNVKKSFKVDIDGTWDGKYLIMKENFIYDDGTKEVFEVIPRLSTNKRSSIIRTSGSNFEHHKCKTKRFSNNCYKNN